MVQHFDHALHPPRHISLDAVTEEATKHSVKVNDGDPKPFVQTKSADDIPASVKRLCLQTSNSRN